MAAEAIRVRRGLKGRPVHKVHKVFRELMVHKVPRATPETQDRREYKGTLEAKGHRAIPVVRVRKVIPAMTAHRAFRDRKAIRAYKAIPEAKAYLGIKVRPAMMAHPDRKVFRASKAFRVISGRKVRPVLAVRQQ